MREWQGVLIVGGYGHVGRQIAERLSGERSCFVRIGGRNARKAMSAASELGCEGTVRATLEGRDEARITASVAACVVESVLRKGLSPGVKHMEKLFAIVDMVACLSAVGVSIDVETPHYFTEPT